MNSDQIGDTHVLCCARSIQIDCHGIQYTLIACASRHTDWVWHIYRPWCQWSQALVLTKVVGDEVQYSTLLTSINFLILSSVFIPWRNFNIYLFSHPFAYRAWEFLHGPRHLSLHPPDSMRTRDCLLRSRRSLSFVLPVDPLHSIYPSATVCNGNAELCSRSYGNVTFMGGMSCSDSGVQPLFRWCMHIAHDSFAFSSDPLARKCGRAAWVSILLTVIHCPW